MPTYKITVETTFTASHALRLPDGSEEPVHTHVWPVAVTVQNNQLNASDYVMDFQDLQARVVKILDPWRGRHLNNVAPFANSAICPSAERIAEQIALVLMRQLSEGTTLAEVRIGETHGCTAVYIP